ncbi:hypothetical protein O181_115542, partial [Austropuccinia psidii MF-1]|nr:hypothetical protein [Austropuccinia psidii MF-1]
MAIRIETKIPTFRAKTHSVGYMVHKLHLAACNGLNALGVSNLPPDQTSTHQGESCVNRWRLTSRRTAVSIKSCFSR